jgi:hypothetical protein
LQAGSHANFDAVATEQIGDLFYQVSSLFVYTEASNQTHVKENEQLNKRKQQDVSCGRHNSL